MVYLLLAKLARRKIILHIHGSNWEGFYGAESRLGRFLKKSSLALPNRIAVLNSEWVRRLVGIGVATEITIVRNCLKEAPRPDPGVVEAVRRDLGVDKGDLLVLIVAAICSWKGIFDLVDAIPKIVRERDSVRFVLVGGEEEPGAMARLTCALAKESLSRWVRVLGEVDRDLVPALLYAADVFLLPSWMEGMPISLLEAMRAGVPVIATNVGAIPDMITDGESGLLISPRNPDGIQEAVLRLSRDVPLRHKVAQDGRKAFEEKFEFSRCIKEMRALYREE
jgi:glycosyltransferase involved in cell wall biosynthesis